MCVVFHFDHALAFSAMDPTTACNMKCTGCWAAEYGKSLNLGLETMDKIVTQGKELGTYWYLFTGGEHRCQKRKRYLPKSNESNGYSKERRMYSRRKTLYAY